MLRDGNFIREPAIVVGRHYTGFRRRGSFTPEEDQLQTALLFGHRRRRVSPVTMVLDILRRIL